MKYYNNKPLDYYSQSRNEMLTYIPQQAKTILDIGCSNGQFGHQIKKSTGALVWGIEYVAAEAEKAAQLLDKVFAGPCEEHIPALPDNTFDVIIFNDVLEHLVDPYSVLELLKPKLTSKGVIIASIPNVRHYNNLLHLLFQKDWHYTSHGILDKTHLRFFTKKSMQRMFTDAGYFIKKIEGINAYRSVKPWIMNIPVLFTHLDIRFLQFAVVAEKNAS